MALLPLFQIADATIMQWQTRWKSLLDPVLQAKPNIVVSKDCGVFSASNVNSLSPAPITNLTVSITTKGGPVLITMQPSVLPGGNLQSEELGVVEQFVTLPNNQYSTLSGTLYLLRGDTIITYNSTNITSFYNTSGSPVNYTNGSGAYFTYTDIPPAGRNTYTLAATVNETAAPVGATDYVIYVLGCTITAYELGT